MKLPLYQVDAFTDRLFGGNPAAIVPLDEWLPDETLQSIAAENNLAETAYFVKRENAYHLRWFTPAIEVDLCGHATLASAWVLFEKLGYAGTRIDFDSRSGRLSVTRKDGVLWLDFPALKIDSVTPHPVLIDAMGAKPTEIFGGMDYLLIYESEDDIAALKPDMTKLRQVNDRRGIIATAPGKNVDFVSRFFAPAAGIDEDPVTGSAHSALIPLWASRLGKTKMLAHQISSRGGELFCELAGDRVKIGGRAAFYLEGTIYLSK